MNGPPWPALALGAALLSLAAPAGAEGRSTGTLLPKYRQECGACHVAYPPGLLPAASWQRLLGGLPRHFGTDASLDAATVAELRTWLAANAGAVRRAASGPRGDRITRTEWFVREHHEVTGAIWKLPAVKSPANCAACHRDADKGNFDEHAVRIPR